MTVARSDYEAIAAYYDRYRAFAPGELRFWLGRLVALGGIEHGQAVLDLGCGTGRFAIPLANGLGAQVVGLDRAAGMISQAAGKEGSGAVRWAVGDAQALPFAAAAFNAVVMSLVIHHVDDRPRALACIHRALGPGGRLVIWTSSHRQIRQFILGRYFPSLVSIDLQRFPAVPLLLAELDAAGFSGIRRLAVRRRESVEKRGFVERVRNRYISTLSLISDAELEAGVRALETDLASVPGDRFARTYRYTFVTAERPCVAQV